MAKVMRRIALFCLLGTVFAALLHRKLHSGFCLSLAITLGTAAYHFIMRLLVGGIVNAVMGNRANCFARWFRPRGFEAGLYRRMRVHAWKKYLPSYNPALFNMKEQSPEAIAQAMCQAELVHEIIIPLSFAPLLAIPRFGAPAAFIITSLLAAAFDLLFVILQRYNRPRILAIARRLRR